jgi:hypothetical protein
MARKKSPPPSAPEAVADYINAASEPAKTRLRRLCAVVRKAAPQAILRMAYGLPTWHQGENLIHLGAFVRHLGVYPGPAAIRTFAKELTPYHTSKGAIQLPHDLDLPLDLVRRMVRWRLEQVAAGAKAKPKVKPTRKAAKPVKLLSGGNPQIAKGEGDGPVQSYIAAMPGWKQAVGKRLDALIVRRVPQVRKAVKWNSPFYGIDGQGWFLSFHVFTRYVKVTFFKGSSLRPLPPGAGKHKEVRYVDIHEDDFPEAQMATWVQKAARIPGWLA